MSVEVHREQPLRVAALIKQVPHPEEMILDGVGRLRRVGVSLELNPYCRRAISLGVTLAKATSGRCTVVTLGPEQAQDVLREGIAWGADGGVHLVDDAFSGSDTLATSRALAAALVLIGPFDVVIVGRKSVDGDTGQVGPEIAELLDLPFAGGVRRAIFGRDACELHLEQDDGYEDVSVQFPVVMSVAERLCEPCKVEPDGRKAVASTRIRRLTSAELGPGPWGESASPTRVGAIRSSGDHRQCRMLDGGIEEILDVIAGTREVQELDRSPLSASEREDRVTGVVLESGRDDESAELVAAARGLARHVAGIRGDVPPTLAPGRIAGVDELVEIVGAGAVEDAAKALASWINTAQPWAVLLPSTSYGRELAGRVAARLGYGLIGDATGLRIEAGQLVAEKPAFAGALVADVTSSSPTTLVTVRPGVLSGVHRSSGVEPITSVIEASAHGRMQVRSRRRDDDVMALAIADVVVGIGDGVAPEDYGLIELLASLLGAEIGATRKVTDKGSMPRARQIGLTGRSLSPRLYVAIGVSGKFNHMVGVRAARTILAVNSDPSAPVFSHADFGIVADWREIVEALATRMGVGAEAVPPS